MSIPIVVRVTGDEVVLSLRKLATKLVSSFYLLHYITQDSHITE